MPLLLQLGLIVAAGSLVFRTLDDQALADGLYAANIWNIGLCLGVLASTVSFATWQGAVVFQKPLWLILGGSLVLCLCFIGYFLFLLVVEHHGRDSLTWYDDRQVLLPILNLGVPVGITAVYGLAILSYRGAVPFWKLVPCLIVLVVVATAALERGSVVSSRSPGFSLSGQVWWLKRARPLIWHNNRWAVNHD